VITDATGGTVTVTVSTRCTDPWTWHQPGRPHDPRNDPAVIPQH
jgi:hypothetical protein